MSNAPHVVESTDSFDPEALFIQGRDQLLVAVRITPVFGQLDLSLAAAVIDEANARGLTLVRETTFREEYLLLVLEAFDEDEH